MALFLVLHVGFVSLVFFKLLSSQQPFKLVVKRSMQLFHGRGGAVGSLQAPVERQVARYRDASDAA